MEKKSSAGKIVILAVVVVGGGLMLLMCAGVLAAIAIPSFVKFQQQSKAAEANMITREMASYAQMVFAEDCAFPPVLAPTSKPADCCGGEKCAANVTGPWTDDVPGLRGNLYFSYTTIPNGDRLEVLALADFECGGAQHAVLVTIVGTRDGENCTSEIESTIVENELE